MNIICCVKQIPDPETPATAFRVDESAMKVVPAQGIAPVVSPFDAQRCFNSLRVSQDSFFAMVDRMSEEEESWDWDSGAPFRSESPRDPSFVAPSVLARSNRH